MSADGSAEAPSDGVKLSYVHTAIPDQETRTHFPVYTSGGGNVAAPPAPGDGKQKFVSYDTALGFHPGLTTCPTCQQQVMTDITFKAGRFAWIICGILLFLGLITCLLTWWLTPMLLHKKFKDAYHTCPRCNRVLHVEKRQCCE